MDNRFDHQKLPAWPAHLIPISEHRHRSLLALKPRPTQFKPNQTGQTQSEPMSSGSYGSSPTSSNQTLTSYAEMRPITQKKGSYRASQGRSANLVDVGLERSGVEGRNHGGRPSVSFSKRSLRGGAGSRRRVRGSCHLVRLRRQDLEAPASRFTSDVKDPEAPPRGSPPANKSSSLSCQKHERKKSSSMRSAS
jgi:hypothetical protein